VTQYANMWETEEAVWWTSDKATLQRSYHEGDMITVMGQPGTPERTSLQHYSKLASRSGHSAGRRANWRHSRAADLTVPMIATRDIAEVAAQALQKDHLRVHQRRCQCPAFPPPRAEYLLTDKGKELGVVVGALAVWGSRHVHPETALVHTDCGEPVQIGYYSALQ
jgi:hypothetical protein